MRTDFHASTVAPWGARARGPAARCRTCGSVVNRWVMRGFPEKRWELDCCAHGASSLKAREVVDIILPRGWDAGEFRQETLRLRDEGGADWDALPGVDLESAAATAGIVTTEKDQSRPPPPAAGVEQSTQEVETATEEETFGLLPNFPFARR